MKFSNVFLFFPMLLLFYCCVPDEIILPGDISGLVTDAETDDRLESASVVLSSYDITADTTITGSDGIFEYNNTPPGFYEIEVSKPGYVTDTRIISVLSKKPIYAPFPLTGTPYPAISETLLDFGVDSTVMSFTIENIGKGELKYYFLEFPDWITFNSEEGGVTTKSDTITVTIDRDKMPRKKIEESISILCKIGDSWKEFNIDVAANRIFYDGYYYGIVRIGTQIWFAENLDLGTFDYRSSGISLYNNGIVEKYCYDDDFENCDTYGGLYEWNEMMKYEPPDNGLIGATQGICPEGWHIPTLNEFETLIEYLGGEEVAGGKLKAEGTTEEGTGLWLSPNEGANNESGFTGLPGGLYADDGTHDDYYGQEEIGSFWSSTQVGVTGGRYILNIFNIDSWIQITDGLPWSTLHSVRCIKDPE